MTRDSFVSRFGEDQAARIEACAEEHSNGINSENKGADPFKWACLIAIGYSCVSDARFAEYHGITVPNDEFRAWCLSDGDLGSHDGDCDYVALLAGAYDSYIKKERTRTKLA